MEYGAPQYNRLAQINHEFKRQNNFKIQAKKKNNSMLAENLHAFTSFPNTSKSPNNFSKITDKESCT